MASVYVIPSPALQHEGALQSRTLASQKAVALQTNPLMVQL
jgi:hypothetical protein